MNVQALYGRRGHGEDFGEVEHRDGYDAHQEKLAPRQIWNTFEGKSRPMEIESETERELEERVKGDVADGRRRRSVLDWAGADRQEAGETVEVEERKRRTRGIHRMRAKRRGRG